MMDDQTIILDDPDLMVMRMKLLKDTKEYNHLIDKRAVRLCPYSMGEIVEVYSWQRKEERYKKYIKVDSVIGFKLDPKKPDLGGWVAHGDVVDKHGESIPYFDGKRSSVTDQQYRHYLHLIKKGLI